LTDETLLKERSLVVEKLWQAIETGIFPLQKFSHVLKEHDLNCWLNFYRLFRPDDLGEFMEFLKQNANRAKKTLDEIDEYFSSESCEIIYGERHVQSWEWNTAAIPFSFSNFRDFGRFFEKSEIQFLWLSCLGEYSGLLAPETRTSKNSFIRKLQFRASDERLTEMSPRQLSSFVEDDRHRLMPCFTNIKVERIDHYTDSSVVTLLLDRRLILPTRAPINNLQEAEMKTYWRDSNTPHHIFKEPHIEKLRIVHKFDAAGKIVQWHWHYEDNDISELPISSPIDKLYQKIHLKITNFLNEHNEEKIERARRSPQIYQNEEFSRLFDTDPKLSTVSKAETFDKAQRPKSLVDKLS